MNQQNYLIDKLRLIHSLQKAAASYDQAAILQREVGQRLLERLDFMRLQPQFIVDAGAGTGFGARHLEKRFRKAKLLVLDIATNMLKQAKRQAGWRSRQWYMTGDMAQMPFANETVDLIFSNLALYWCNDIHQVFREWQRILKPGGLLIFSSLGVDTLKELRNSWKMVDNYAHVNVFTDMHDLGDALMQANFIDPVMEVENISLLYQDLNQLFTDLKSIGERNVIMGRPRGLVGTARWQALQANYEKYRNASGQLPASYEIIFGHAWKSTRFIGAKANEQGVVQIPLRDIKRTKK